ncbi:MAG: precorrin-2 C(20)-methyltransferase [Pelagibacteraceae bacterium]|nr:precorrin-2 C(20)-methyltransferase [Pelagibacteraceae bacterium]PPR10895.1 MAG: Precorrin-2 C(20)-methyltransferase [Alphaproteobacteria bacterium MarineAlpha11_Bin1]|tara:strand:- start:11030 stop:11734 length:705 start_codon:yes stop_codon:yes gene_type:complete
MVGRLYGVGVGPGDPELLTLKALRILKSVPVLAWPAPEEGPSLARQIVAEHLPGTQREIAIRMPLLPARFPSDDVYDKAAIEIDDALSAGDDVAVICEGDPFFYGSFMYLFGRLVGDHAIEVVPGVSSLTACAAALGSPLSAKNDVLSVIPGPLDAKTLAKRLVEADAAAIIKVGRHLEKIRSVLADLGLSENARYIERATMDKQRVVRLADVGDGDAPYFSMILLHKRAQAWK